MKASSRTVTKLPSFLYTAADTVIDTRGYYPSPPRAFYGNQLLAVPLEAWRGQALGAAAHMHGVSPCGVRVIRVRRAPNAERASSGI